jgi:hypothetical protein
MAIGANSYGSTAGVAGLTQRYVDTSTKLFTTGTRPTLATAENWIDSASATLNVALAAQGFSIPVTQADAKLSLDSIVNEVCSDLANASNSSGRFFTDRALTSGISPMRSVRKELMEWVEQNAAGLESLGATRSRSLLDGILVRDTDESGREVEPIFQRGNFGNEFESMHTEAED